MSENGSLVKFSDYVNYSDVIGTCNLVINFLKYFRSGRKSSAPHGASCLLGESIKGTRV